MEHIYKGRHFLITGAGSDIGNALITCLLNDPSNRILTTSRHGVNPFPKKICDNYCHLDAIDLTQQESLHKLCLKAHEFFHEPFNIIHSVGDFWYHRSLEDTPLCAARKMIESHYCTLYGLTHTMIPVFKRVGGGKLIAFSCNSVGYNYPEMAAFTSAKAAVECFIKCVAHEYSRFNITANVIALSTIRTPKVEQTKNKKYHRDYITVEELAATVLEITEMRSLLISGNVIRLLKYSDSFYNEGYFQRNPPSSNVT